MTLRRVWLAAVVAAVAAADSAAQGVGAGKKTRLTAGTHAYQLQAGEDPVTNRYPLRVEWTSDGRVSVVMALPGAGTAARQPPPPPCAPNAATTLSPVHVDPR